MLSLNNAIVETQEVPRPSVVAQMGSVVVKIGPEETEYVLHKTLLAQYSGYFRGPLLENFKETNEGVMILRYVEPEPFNEFVDWLYSGCLPELGECDYDTFIASRYHLYVLTDMLKVPEMKRAVLDSIFEHIVERYPSYKLVMYAFENLPEDDVLLQLLVDAQCLKGGPVSQRHNQNEDILYQVPRDFLVRVIQKINNLHNINPLPINLQREWYSLPPPPEDNVEDDNLNEE